jgi:16S rRNA A1518/A1519 N6-dimethyltransferase RsmA/KsgA/DIM1 with predicted DNA glycosylase/AP lyase activity
MSVAPFVTSPEKVVRKMLDMAQLRQRDVLFDLGCGDGRIVVIATRDYSVKAFGVEMREDLVTTARERIKEFNLDGRAEIIQGDFFNVDVSKANVVTLYLTTRGNERLKLKFEKELRSNSRIVSHDFSIRGWKALEVSQEPQGHTIYLYKMGKNL